MTEYLYQHETFTRTTIDKVKTLERAIKLVVRMHYSKAKEISVSKFMNEDGKAYLVRFMTNNESHEYEIPQTKQGVFGLFNQLAEQRRSYDSFDIQEITQ